MAPQRTWFLVSNFSHKPNTGPIALGSIIADPFRPHRVLSAVDAEALATRYPSLEKTTNLDHKISRSTGREISTSVWTRYLQFIGGSLSGNLSQEDSENYAMDALETVCFVADPSLVEIEARMKESRVKAVTKSGAFAGIRHPVYLVSGIMIAKGLAISREAGQRQRAGIGGGAGALTPAGDVSAGASVEVGQRAGETDSWRADEDRVFAYRLLKVIVKGVGGRRVQYDEFRHKAAFLGRGDDEDSDDESDNDTEILMKALEAADVAVDKDTSIKIEDIVHSGDSLPLSVVYKTS